MIPYDKNCKDSIIKHAEKLLGKSLRSLYPIAVEDNAGSRGRLGQAVERYHFGYAPNSESRPDFPEAGLELKCTPLKELSDHSLVSKERLVLNIINYVSEAGNTFENSSFWKKNNDLLLMFYLHEYAKDGEPRISYLDFIFKIVREWQFPEIDKKIIQDDWETIHSKIVNNRAHELSEGDTLYLGACTKGSRAGEEMCSQVDPNAEKAQQRAYSLKSSYLNRIILDSIYKSQGCCSDFFVSERQRKSWLAKFMKANSELGSIVKDRSELSNKTLEQLIVDRFSNYYGKTVKAIIEEINDDRKKRGQKAVLVNTQSKSFAFDLCRAVLDVNQKRILEFENSELQLKTVQLEPSGKTIKESMSFPNIRYTEIVNEEVWEDSFWYKTLTKRFLFVVFQKNIEGNRDKAVLRKVQFWTMPCDDLLIAERFWADTKIKVAKGDYNHFIKMSDNMICHVRPKAQKATDTMMTPQGLFEKKKCYWLNKTYIANIVFQNMLN